MAQAGQANIITVDAVHLFLCEEKTAFTEHDGDEPIVDVGEGISIVQEDNASVGWLARHRLDGRVAAVLSDAAATERM